MSIKLEEFRLESYKEREILVTALMIWAIHRPEEANGMYREVLHNLETRLANTQCMEGGCSICGDGNWESDFNE